MADQFDEWGARWAAGMRQTAELASARREAAKTVAVAHRAQASRCGIKGCKRSGGRRGLCKVHYELVPDLAKVERTIAIFRAQLEAKRRADRKLVKVAQTIVDEQLADAELAIATHPIDVDLVGRARALAGSHS